LKYFLHGEDFAGEERSGIKGRSPHLSCSSWKEKES